MKNDKDNKPQCMFEFEWHDKYEKIMEAFGGIQATSEIDEVQSCLCGIHCRSAVAGGKKIGVEPACPSPAAETIKAKRQRTADPCSRFLLIAVLLFSILQFAISLAIHGALHDIR